MNKCLAWPKAERKGDGNIQTRVAVIPNHSATSLAALAGLTLLCAALHPLLLQPSAAAEENIARGPTTLGDLLGGAVEFGDKSVAEAGDYNRRHVLVLTSPKNAAQAALQDLAKVGDEFTLDWLKNLEGRRPELERQWLTATAEQIRRRLKEAPTPIAEVVPARLLRAAWADVTCNAIEAELKNFVLTWAKDRQEEPAFQAELRKLLRERVQSTSALGPHTIRERAQSYARAFLVRDVNDGREGG